MPPSLRISPNFQRPRTSRLEVHATGRGLFYACRSCGHLAVTFREGKQKNGYTPFLCPQSINSKNHICLCYEERKHSNAMTAATPSRPSTSNGKQRHIPSRCPAPSVVAATPCQSPCSLLWRKGYTGRFGNKSTINNEK